MAQMIEAFPICSMCVLECSKGKGGRGNRVKVGAGKAGTVARTIGIVGVLAGSGRVAVISTKVLLCARDLSSHSTLSVLHTLLRVGISWNRQFYLHATLDSKQCSQKWCPKLSHTQLIPNQSFDARVQLMLPAFATPHLILDKALIPAGAFTSTLPALEITQSSLDQALVRRRLRLTAYSGVQRHKRRAVSLSARTCVPLSGGDADGRMFLEGKAPYKYAGEVLEEERNFEAVFLAEPDV
eukprot:491243-Pelagomonas_calceolata.AAC.5